MAIELVAEVFRNHYLAAGDVKADWEACFRTWILRERVPASGSALRPAQAFATSGRDPALVKIEIDSRLAVPPPAMERERLAQLRKMITGTSVRGRS